MEPLFPWPRIVFFDGICILCNKSVDFLIRHDKKGRLKFAALQSEAADHLLSSDHTQPANPETILYYDNGRIYDRSTAVLKILKELRQPWPVFSYLIIIPRPIRDWIYDFIARYRYRWFGRRKQCRLPDEKTSEVILD
ncbi:MAG: DCC1-like thiol-disulfide oxidoreductase family protein [Bacteroidales bacterium]|jgi:predicted DCC family thiol-disulfide oxidoreductase YuxK